MSQGLAITGNRPGFTRSHGFALSVLWVQIPALAFIGLSTGESIYEVSLTSLGLVALAVGGMAMRGKRMAAFVVSLGLVSTSAVIANYAGTSEVAYLHLFLMICVVSFYRDDVVLTLGVSAAAAFQLAAVAYGTTTLSSAATHIGILACLALLLAVGWRVTRPVAHGDESGDRFRVSFEAAPIGMAVLKPSGEILEVNPSMARILGSERSSLIGSNVSGLIHGDDQVELGEAWEEMGNSPEHSATEWMRWLTGDGRPIWGRVSVSLVPRTDDHPAMVVLQLADTGSSYEEQRRLEALLKGRDEFVAAVGDEIREPLGMLIDLTDMAEHAHVDSRETLPRIEVHAKEIASIVDDLVVSARADATSAVSHDLDVGALCREVVSSMPGAGHVDLEIEATMAWADPGLTRQILNNLVGNAVRYGGPAVSLSTFRSGPDTVIQVTDDGPELPVAERERVFSGDLRNGPPVTRPAAVGLSIAVSRHLARQMEGEVVYRRTKEDENIFELRLPSEQIREIPRRRGVMSTITLA